MIDPGREGFVLSEADMGGLAEKLEWLANRSGERVAMGRAARAKIEALGGWDAYGDRMEALVRELALGRAGQ